MLELDGVEARRGNFGFSVTARCDHPVTGVFGASGCGKTTLLHLVAGLLCPQAGRLLLDDEVLFDHSARRHVPPHERRIGVVFQDGRLLPHLSVEANLRYGERLVPPTERRLQQGPVVELLEIGPLLDRRPRQLSGGERQRVALGRSLLASPHLLLLDEPLAALDRPIKQQILPFLQRVRDELAIPMLYVSHDLGEILQMTSQLLVIADGRVAGHGHYTDLAIGGDVASSALVNVLRGRVAGHEAEHGVTEVEMAAPSPSPDAPGGPVRLRVPLVAGVPVGAPISLTLGPEDIALARSRVEGTSIQNQIPGVLRRVRDERGIVLAEVDIGAPLLLEITRQSLVRLGLAPGTPVWCLVKTNALRVQRPANGDAKREVGGSQ